MFPDCFGSSHFYTIFSFNPLNKSCRSAFQLHLSFFISNSLWWCREQQLEKSSLCLNINGPNCKNIYQTKKEQSNLLTYIQTNLLADLQIEYHNPSQWTLLFSRHCLRLHGYTMQIFPVNMQAFILQPRKKVYSHQPLHVARALLFWCNPQH